MKSTKLLRSAVKENVARLRQERGWSAAELGRRSDVNRTGIAHIEAGERQPDLATVERLADAFGVSPLELLGGEEPPSRPLPHDEEAILQAYRRLKPESRERAIWLLQGMALESERSG